MLGWVPQSENSLGNGLSSVEAWYSTALDIEEVLSGVGSDQLHVMVADVIKSFDTVNPSILDCAFGRLGLPAWFRKVYFSFHAHVRLRFKLATGLGESWCRDGGGIPQGCPLSMVFIFALYVPWCRRLEAMPAVKPQLYADNLKCTAECPASLFNASRFTAQYVRAGVERDGSRSWLRHERMTVAMALAEVTHHTAPRGQKTARARGEESDELYDAKGLMTPPPSRPTPLVEVRPQGRVLRHVVEDLGEFALMVQILDAPVPQMVDYVAEALRLLDRPMAEQVIEVPTDLLLSVSIAFSCSCAAVSGTVGGSADRSDSHPHRLADRGTDRRHSSSSWSWSRFSPRTEFNSDVFFFFGTHS